MASWVHDAIVPLGVYDSEHRTVWTTRLVVHFAGCAMVFTGNAKHPFLATNRWLLSISFLLGASCMVMEEAYALWHDPTVRLAKLLCFKLLEACIASLVLFGCFLLRSITLRETYRLNWVFFVAVGLHFTTLLTDNAIKLGYLGNSIIAAVAFFILRDFLAAFQVGGPGGSTESENVRALMHLQGILTVLNFVTFLCSFHYNAFGLKLAQYVLQIFTITLFYIFVRPYIQADSVKKTGDVELLVGPDP